MLRGLFYSVKIATDPDQTKHKCIGPYILHQLATLDILQCFFTHAYSVD